MDLIRVNDLTVNVLLSSGASWPAKGSKPTSQLISISIAVPHDIHRTAVSDDLIYSVNYSTISSTIRSSISPSSSTDLSPSFRSLEHVCQHIFDLLLRCEPPLLSVLSLKIIQLKAPLHCKHVGIEATASSKSFISISHFLEDIECHAIVGIHPWERLEKQVVKISASLVKEDLDLNEESWLDFREIVRRIYQSIGNSTYLTLEALVSFAAEEILRELPASWSSGSRPTVKVKAAKPSALVFAASSEVETQRTFDDYPIKQKIHLAIQHIKDMHSVAIALGSNLGDRFFNIELALRLLETPQELLQSDDCDADVGLTDVSVIVVDTSFLYESSPMYVTDQPSFINCACMVETNLEPRTLLRLLKKIEALVGRVPSIRNGPRAVDLDIILFDRLIVDTRPENERLTLYNLESQLVIPHPRMVEREFVLRPLTDMIPAYIHPVYGKRLELLLKDLLSTSNDPHMNKAMPFPRLPVDGPPLSVPATLTHWTFATSRTSGTFSGLQTHIMATLNATPDSFSDGSVHNTLESGLAYAREAAQSGASIIDVGGYSTRPGASFVSPEEETTRVVSMISAIRKEANQAVREMLVSVDTFRPEVAKAAILTGANCINDVCSFTGPDSYPYPSPVEEQRLKQEQCLDEMKALVRQFSVPVVLMHSRGDASKNKDYEEYTYVPTGQSVVEGVRVELGAKVERIVKGKGGVRRWCVIVDPGIGFSKTVEGNLELLRNASQIIEETCIGKASNRRRNPLAQYPQLIGTSRKSFLGTILAGNGGGATAPNERDWATAAAVTCAVQQGSTVVRVHDCLHMKDVVRTADVLYRRM